MLSAAEGFPVENGSSQEGSLCALVLQEMPALDFALADKLFGKGCALLQQGLIPVV